MIDAHDAYKLSKQMDANEKVLEKIEKVIRSACKHGEFETIYCWRSKEDYWNREDIECNHEAIKEALIAKHYFVIDTYYQDNYSFQADGICIQWRMEEKECPHLQ